ncbi:hypothetical protein DFH07DRAFT_765286 [Mycena maculata]|uniref:Uncharacterized protein n=1 Tax=Mycena maculata TaxID=230809 RepID=A0AAD7KAZ3_9AGAR|nr:hypothetical protein DFH07DRAFT_765286 [Mycena maculata]
MPPKGSGALCEEDFIFNEDRTKAQCKVCSARVLVERRTWMKSAAKHLQYPEHKKAVERVEGARKQAEELWRERQAESAASGLRNSTFAAPANIQGPIAAAVQERSLAEVKMWEAYEAHGIHICTSSGCGERRRFFT